MRLVSRMGSIGPWVGVLGLCVELSGCVAAAIPLFAAGGLAFSGFAAYKTIQTAGGGSIEIQFPSKDGKTIPPAPIAPAKRVAVWPGDEGDVMFAQRLQASGRFIEVASPATVQKVLIRDGASSDLKQLTDEEQRALFDGVCAATRADIIFGARSLGVSSNNNAFSFSKANVTYKSDLFGYGCATHQIVWRDQIALVINAGTSVTDTTEMNRAGAEAWSDRVLAAMGFAPPPQS